jgi:hypothetical protein
MKVKKMTTHGKRGKIDWKENQKDTKYEGKYGKDIAGRKGNRITNGRR